MIALFFEVTPRAGQDDRYLEIAAALRPELERSGGCLFIDRFRSLARPRTLLSHQLWADEASLARWRANGRHHGAQTAGRQAVFEDYRLRVGAVVAHRSPAGGVQHAVPGQPYNDPARVLERHVLVVRTTGAAFAIPDATGETWRSVYAADRFAWVAEVRDAAHGLSVLRAAPTDADAAQLCLVSRDYGLLDRAEAPQYFPPVS